MQTFGKILATTAVVLLGLISATSLSAQGQRDDGPVEGLTGALPQAVEDLQTVDRDLFQGSNQQFKKAAEIIAKLCTIIEDRFFCPGDEAKVVFVTSSTHFGNIPGVGAADFFCNVRAASAGFNGFFKAWISDSPATEPAATFAQSVVPYVLPGGQVIAADWNGLVNPPLAHPIDQDENGAMVGPTSPWTSTDNDGTHLEFALGPNQQFTFKTDCEDWFSADPFIFPGPEVSTLGARAIVGLTSSIQDWSFFPQPGTLVGEASCAFKRRLYCFEQ